MRKTQPVYCLIRLSCNSLTSLLQNNSHLFCVANIPNVSSCFISKSWEIALKIKVQIMLTDVSAMLKQTVLTTRGPSTQTNEAIDLQLIWGKLTLSIYGWEKKSVKQHLPSSFPKHGKFLSTALCSSHFSPDSVQALPWASALQEEPWLQHGLLHQLQGKCTQALWSISSSFLFSSFSFPYAGSSCVWHGGLWEEATYAAHQHQTPAMDTHHNAE